MNAVVEMLPMKSISIDKVRVDDSIQSRERLNDDVVTEYTEAMLAGASFTPIVVFSDGTDLLLADGFHRYRAARNAGITSLSVEVRKGGRRDAILYAVGANASHGLRRSNADKRKAVALLLDDAEWSQWSDHEIARRCFVSQPLVSSMRPRVLPIAAISEPTVRKFQHRSGKTTTMQTGNIGKRQAAAGRVERTRDSAARVRPDEYQEERQPERFDQLVYGLEEISLDWDSNGLPPVEASVSREEALCMADSLRLTLRMIRRLERALRGHDE